MVFNAGTHPIQEKKNTSENQCFYVLSTEEQQHTHTDRSYIYVTSFRRSTVCSTMCTKIYIFHTKKKKIKHKIHLKIPVAAKSERVRPPAMIHLHQSIFSVSSICESGSNIDLSNADRFSDGSPFECLISSLMNAADPRLPNCIRWAVVS